jgi:thiamine kinase-like enzyme
MNITIDIEKELKEATKARQATVDEINKLAMERQAVITEALKPVQGKLQHMDATRQNLLQEALKQDGEVRRLQSMKDRATGAKKPKKKRK